MVTQRKSCLDNPTKPPKAFLDVIGKRRKRERAAMKEKWTPVLRAAFNEYRAVGRTVSKESADAFIAQLEFELEAALNGDYDHDDITCAYCEFTEKERERQAQAAANGQVRALPPKCLAASCVCTCA